MKKTNVIVILIDDMGCRDIGRMGSTFYETPNIDKLCEDGMTFENAYASCPVCSPSRASYLTGRYPARVGITDWIDHSGKIHPLKGKLVDAPYLKYLPTESKTIAGAFHDNGYATWHVGKWHLGAEEFNPLKFGFEKNIGGCEWGHPKYGYFSPYQNPCLPDGPKNEYLTDRLTDEAIGLIKKEKERPFFLSLCHYTVHTPIQAKEEDIIYFEQKAKNLKLNTKESFAVGEEYPILKKKGQHVCRRVIQSDPIYAAMIKNLDENIGKLMNCLKDTNHLDDTIILFTSDNGGLSTINDAPTCNFPAKEGKGWMYDGGTRVPLFVWYPEKIKRDTTSYLRITTTDIFPTLLELAQIRLRPEEHVDGRSFCPELCGKSMEERPLFWHYPHYGNQGGTPGASVVFGDYKLIKFFEDDRLELYNLKNDFSENNNIADIESEKTKELHKLLEDWMVEVSAIIPEKNKEV